MIISYEHEFVFFHVPKTGGSSLAVYLSQFLGDADIMVDAWNDALQSGVGYNEFLLRQLNDPVALEYIREGISRRIKDKRILERPVLDFAFRKMMRSSFGSESVHMKWRNVEQYDPVAFRKFKKFTLVRNPFSHAVSLFRWQEKDWSLNIRTRNKKNSSAEITNAAFKKYLRALHHSKIKDPEFYPSGLDIFYDPAGEELKVDFVLKLEEIRSGVDWLNETFNLGLCGMDLPHTKNSGGIAIEDLYCSECESLVRDIWKVELDLFGYSRPF